jgi:hypothetical protein
MPKITISNDVFRPLTGWVHGKGAFVKSAFHYENEAFIPQLTFVALEAVFDVHEAPDLPLKTLEQSWLDTKKYLTSACNLIGSPKAGHPLNTSEKKLVISTLGEPPTPAWPLYFFSVGDHPDETIVYIGKTNSGTHRFASGHKAITLLHHPKFNGLTKRLYLATVTIVDDEDNYIPLDWLHPKDLRDTIYSDIEAQLIFHFQPEFNSDLKSKDASKKPLPLTLHNHSGTHSFDATGISPHRTVPVTEWY